MRHDLKKSVVSSLIITLLLVQVAFAQDAVDQRVLARIRTEGFQNSQIMEALGYMTDVFGPRLTNSPNERAAQRWARDKMTEWGLENARLEPWGEFGKGWNVERFSMEMTAPYYERLIAHPRAWTPATKGPVSGTPVVVEISSPSDFDKYRGKLNNAIVMNGRFSGSWPASRYEPLARRFTDEELARAARETNPRAAGIQGGPTTNYLDEDKEWRESLQRRSSIIKFFRDEGIAALVEPSRLPYSILQVTGFYETEAEQNVPAFVLAREQYARIVRLLDRSVAVRLDLNLQTRFHNDATGYNVIGEIPGTDPKLRDEIVLLGGHFDSWHAGTGATDNAAGCLVMMEAARILKAIGTRPRRTVRVALWSGEEQDYYGSMGYVRQHFGDPFTLQLKPNHSKLSVYFNLDNGTGRIRGIYLQGNEAARPIFESWLAPFQYLGASTVTILNTGGTDHMPFDAVGLPGFQFIQDPVDYSSRTHHTNLDVLEAVSEEDLKVNAVIVAGLAYHAAMRDEKIPRKALPKVPATR